MTFLVASDTHIGYRAPDDPGRDPLAEPHGIELTNLAMIRAMNSIEGKPYPPPLGGRVRKPRGVLITGDLTEHGGKEQWRMWTRFYGLTGREGALEYPVFEGAGNHDRNRNWHVREQVAKRHGGRFYTLDWGDLRLVCLGEAPDEHGLRHLEEALDGAAPDVPFLIYFHYPLLGAYAEDNWFGRGDFRERLAALLRGRRVLGIFHGHYHASGAYRWQGIDVYNVGSPKHYHHSFAVVEIREQVMKVASYNYELKQWFWWHEKALESSGAGDERVGVADALDDVHRPAFSLTARRSEDAESGKPGAGP